MFENIDTSLIDWSRAQFALTAMYHWLFVPLTLGLAVIMGLMETFYVTTGKEFWKNTAKFWMKLFGINFAVGVATGLILEFEFGTNWSNYSGLWAISSEPHWLSKESWHFYGSHFHCRHVLRLEQSEQAFPSGIHLAHRTGSNDLRLVDSGRQCLDAIPRRDGFQSRNSKK